MEAPYSISTDGTSSKNTATKKNNHHGILKKGNK